MKSLFRKKDDGELLQAYCKANNLAISGNTVFPKKVYLIYRIVSVIWCIGTGVYVLRSTSNAWHGLDTGLMVSLAAYAVVFLVFHIKFGVSKDKVEEEVQFMRRMNR